MNYIPKLRLQHMALIKIAATLWNQGDVKDLFSKFCIPSIHKELSKWVQMEAVVVEKVAKLPLPKHMEEKLLCLIRPVGFQISKWRQFHYNISVDLPNEFSWTPRGKINKKKTAELMIKDQSIDITTHYKLACIFCLEDDIAKLWEKMPEDCRKSFYSQEDPMHVNQYELVVFWTYHIKGEMNKMESMIEKRMGWRSSPFYYAFRLAKSDGNRVATEYFLEKLTTAEMEESLSTIIDFQLRDVLNESTSILEKFLDGPYIVILCSVVSITTLFFLILLLIYSFF